MVRLWRKCVLILHKHLQIRMYHYFLTVCEIMLPCTVALILAWLKTFEYELLAVMNPDVFSEEKFQPEDEYYPAENPLQLIKEAIGVNFTVFYAPENNYTQSLVRYCEEQLKFLPVDDLLIFYGFDLDTMNEIIKVDSSEDYFPDFVLLFEEIVSLVDLPITLKYRMIVDKSNEIWLGNVGVTLQHLVALHYIKTAKGYDVLSEVSFAIQRFPEPGTKMKGNFIYYLTVFYFGHLIPLCFIFTIPVFLTQIVMEKQTGMKELMRLMGLPIMVQWFGFFANSFVTMFITSTTIVLLLTSDIFPGVGALITQTGFGHLLLLFTLYTLTCIAFCFFLSTLCSDENSRFFSATRATLFGIMIWSLTFMTPYLLTDAENFGTMETYKQFLFTLNPNVALFWSLRLVGFLERQDGLKWEHYYTSPTLAEDLYLLPLLVMFLVDVLVYCLLGWYIDQINPGPYGVPQPWYFLFKKSYWSSCFVGDQIPDDTSIISSIEEPPNCLQRLCQEFINPVLRKLHIKAQRTESKLSVYEGANFEREPDLPKVLQVNRLTKVFKQFFGPPFVAVNKVTFNAFDGEILVLLGHNGAGKTVTMSMITGTYYPTGGSVFIHGHSMLTQRNKAREAMSFCPQHAIFFPELTVKQHFVFFGRLKGLRGASLREEVDYLLHKLKLWPQKGQRGKELSGGMLRRLQLGIAAIGNVYFVVLDEPTSGLDPEARRLVWDLLLELRSSCCILLTTHNMEEADALADRIAIMSHGKLICCGSPMFLRHRFGATYMMKVTKSVGCKVDRVVALVRRYVPEAVIDSNTHTELSIVLPSSHTRFFPDLFRAIESNLDDLKISTFGLSTMGLEEVFLKVTEAAEKTKTMKQGRKSSVRNTVKSVSTEVHLQMKKGAGLCCQRLLALFMKRVYYLYHRGVFFFSQFAIVIAMSILVLLIVRENFDSERMVSVLESIFDPSRNVVVFLSESTNKFCLADAFEKNIPEHVTVSESDPIDMVAKILALAKSDILGFSTGHYLVGARFTPEENETVLAVALYYDPEISIPYFKLTSLMLVHNAVLLNCHKIRRMILQDVQIRNMRIDPPSETRPKLYVTFLKHLQNMLAAMFLSIGLSLLCSSFVFLTTHERITRAKHLQLMTGTSCLLFWTTAFVFDFMFYFVGMSLSICILMIWANESVISQPEIPEIMFIAMVLYGFSAIPLSYLVSFFPKTVSSAYITMVVIHLVSCILCAALHEAAFALQRKDGIPVSPIIIYGSLIPDMLPGCCLTVIFIRLWLIALLEQHGGMCGNFCAEYWDMGEGGVGHLLILLPVSGICYMVILVLLELRLTRFVRCCTRKDTGTFRLKGEQDVEDEYYRIKELVDQRRRELEGSDVISMESTQGDVLLVDGLSKRFTRNFLTVDHLTFGVQENECFGLLGVNGAGKTTTFRMLTGDLRPSAGNAYLQNADLLKSREKFLSQVGYCPQFDAVLDHLTARETLFLFANLRGVKKNQIKVLVNDYLRQFGLSDYAYKITANYSLGTKRRLSAAVAFLGVPALVMMDEPTTGVDPASRRKIWEVILQYISKGTSIILTSHSMDECEVLCTRLAIMKKGQLKCIGGVQYLKAKFGKCFKVYIKLPKLADVQRAEALHDKVQSFMQDTFKRCIKRDEHEGLLEYSVPYDSTSWQKLFAVMEQAMEIYNLDDYSVCQATLEQIFLGFAEEPSSGGQ